ncbi:Sacsin [Bienertia sinuspersici]
MATDAKQHIEEIRKNKFWIGVGKNPLRKTLRMAVKYLSAELYSKDVHFLMELIQNAEDNEYPEGVEPSLEFLITSQDITATGAPATLLIFNNEKGFSKRNMESICDVGDSTKAGNRKKGYIGEKGIGFKSVFLLTAHPHIFSNGYQIRFNETPCPECDIAYIVPEWVDNPSVSDIQKLYGLNRVLPTTTLILPLKVDKVKAVKEQLSSLHPELLLFLSKIKRLSVKEGNDNPALNTVRAISISSERDFVAKKNIDAESYTVHLTAEEEDYDPEGQCFYYMWRQKFPVKKENKVEKRLDIEEWAITLAFPYGKRLNRGMSSPGIYAFLPTETVTNMPFIIQADFLLPSSRETILWDDIWNQGILDCVPTAFVNAFVSLVRTCEDAPVANLASRFAFLPINPSCHPKLDAIRESIKEKLLVENILPSESHSNQRIFHKPDEVGRLNPSFWKILHKAKEEGVKLYNLSSQGKHILHSSFDISKYNDVLNFLNVKHVGNDWYSRCIQSCNLVSGVGEGVYMELLQYLAQNWASHFKKTSMGSIPLLKYVDASGNLSLLSVDEAANQSSGTALCRSQDVKHISWLIEWSQEFGTSSNLLFLSEKMQKGCLGMETVRTWLRNYAEVKTLGISGYASLLLSSLKDTSRLAFAFAHFLYHSYSCGFLSKSEVGDLCAAMPLVNSYGGVSLRRKGVLVPANGSKWVELLGGSDPWGKQNYVVLSNEYLRSGRYAGHCTPEKELINFLKRHAGASDIPDICPPDAAFPTVYGPLTKENAFLLLDWIRMLRYKGIKMPGAFLSCVANGSWLKVTMSGASGYKPPNESFLPSSSWGSLLQNGSEMVDIPLVDQRYYGSKISDYQEELKAIGVMFEYGQACTFIGKHLMALAADYNLTKTKVIVMLNFIRFLREKYLSVEEIVNSIKKEKWVKTSCGEKSPIETVLYDDSWKSASEISDIPFLDQEYYGSEILLYKAELNILGITLGFQENYKIVIDHLKPSASLNGLLPDHFIFALKCICSSPSSGKLVTTLKEARCLKTNVGFKYPAGCFLLDQNWGCILKVFDSFSYTDSTIYGREIYQFKEVLRKIGVVVDFDATSKAFSSEFKKRASSKLITKENVNCFISCYRKLVNANYIFPSDFTTCVAESKWLRTRLGDCRSPKDCILFSADWYPISKITLLPFIDDSEGCYGEDIHEYKDELERMGVVIDFRKGSRFVLSHVFFPQYPRDITPESVISLLDCVRNFSSGNLDSLPKDFLEKVCQTRWLKTTYGYMLPKESLLFDPKLKSIQRNDGPFIDEEHYGSIISSYMIELAAIGVITDMSSSNAKSLLASHIESLSEFAKIERIYDFLSQSDWKPDDGVDAKIWIPTSLNDGLWATSKECVLHDDNNLFSSRLHVLDQKKYRRDLLSFFSNAFEVRSKPSSEDFCSLWKEWECSNRVVSLDECHAFWRHVIVNWSKKTQKMFAESINKIPAASSGSSNIVLVKKQDIFLPDDLLLKDLFKESSSCSLFVWCPFRNMPSIPRIKLFDIYSKIGVRKISDSVEITQQTAIDYGELKKVEMKDAFIVKGLVMIILGFLAEPSLNMEVKRRHEAVKMLLNVRVFETQEPVSMTYSLKMSSGDIVTASTRQMVRWERESSEFFIQRLDRSGGCKNVVEYATKFSEVVSKGLLWDFEDHIYGLSELIKFGFLMDFDEDAVTYFMKSKNMHIFQEDEEFLSSVFPSC